MMRKALITCGIVAGLIVVVTVAALIFVSQLDVGAYRGLIEREVEAATGRNLTIGGDMKINLSLPPGVMVEDVSLANAPWGTRPVMAHVDRLIGQVRLLPLLSGDVKIVRVVVDGVDVLLETDSQGRANWIFDSASGAPGQDAPPGEETPGGRDAGSGPASIPPVRQVDISDLDVTYRDGRTGEATHAALRSLTLSADDFVSPLRLTFEGSLGAADVSGEGSIGAIAWLDRAETPFPIDLAIEATGLSAAVKGSVVRPLSPEAFTLAVSATASDLGGFGEAARLPLPASPPLRVSGTIKGTPEAISIPDFDARMAESELAGTVKIAFKQPRPVLDMTLRSKRIDLSALEEQPSSASSPTGGATSGGDDGRVFSDEPLPFQALDAVDGTLSLRVEQLAGLALALDSLSLEASLSHGRLTVRSASANTADGSVKVQGAVSLGTPPRVALTGEAREVRMGPLLAMAGIGGLVSGSADIDAELSSQGPSVRALMAALDGELRLVSRDGRIESGIVNAISTGVLEPLAILRGKDKQALKCAVADFLSDSGHVRTHAFVVESANVAIIGTGGVNLATETVDMQFTPRARSLNALKLASVPVSLTGTLANPKFGVSAGDAARGAISSVARLPKESVGAVLGLVEGVVPGLSVGIDDADYCAKALAGKAVAPHGVLPAGTGESGATPGASQRSDTAETLGGTLKSFGKGLENLFKD